MRANRQQMLKRRHRRIRKRINGTAERPRLCVHKSLKHIYVQLVDDASGRTLLSVTSNTKDAKSAKSDKKSFRNIETARLLGQSIAEKAADIGVKSVVFDRGGSLYHGCVKALAEAARKAGLKI